MQRRIVRRRESRFAAADGLSLFRRAWLPERADAILAVVHGFGEHSGRYDHVGAWFAERNYGVHAYDHRGHGRSAGPRCHVRRFEDYLDDLVTFLERIREEHPKLPIVLLGHSMGGLVVAACLCERDPEVVCAVLSGPALTSPRVSNARRFWGRVARTLLPRVSVQGGVDPELLSRDPEVVRAYEEDPLVTRKATVSLMTELLSAIERTRPAGAQARVPVLVLHGEEDRIVSPEGSREFALTLRDPHSTLRVLPQLRHEILNEPEQEVLFREILEWLAKPMGESQA